MFLHAHPGAFWRRVCRAGRGSWVVGKAGEGFESCAARGRKGSVPGTPTTESRRTVCVCVCVCSCVVGLGLRLALPVCAAGAVAQGSTFPARVVVTQPALPAGVVVAQAALPACVAVAEATALLEFLARKQTDRVRGDCTRRDTRRGLTGTGAALTTARRTKKNARRTASDGMERADMVCGDATGWSSRVVEVRGRGGRLSRTTKKNKGREEKKDGQGMGCPPSRATGVLYTLRRAWPIRRRVGNPTK